MAPKWLSNFTGLHGLAKLTGTSKVAQKSAHKSAQKSPEQQDSLPHSAKGKEPEQPRPGPPTSDQDHQDNFQDRSFVLTSKNVMWPFMWSSWKDKDDTEMAAENSATAPVEEQINALLEDLEEPTSSGNAMASSLLASVNGRRAGNMRHSGFPVAAANSSRLISPVFPSIPIPVPKLDFLQMGAHNIIAEIQHTEMWGVELVTHDRNHIPTRLILAKFLQANNGDAIKALAQLRAVFIWRKQMKPRDLMKAVYSAKKFAGLGYLHEKQGVDGKVIVTFVLYGQVSDELLWTPRGLEEYTCWRVALMEMAIDRLRLGSAKNLPNWHVADAYRLIQVLDLTGFQTPSWAWPTWTHPQRRVRETLATNYPDLVSETFVTGNVGCQQDFPALDWPSLPNNTLDHVIFVDSRCHLAAKLPMVVGEWPREFSLNENGPSVCEGAGPELDFAEDEAYDISHGQLDPEGWPVVNNTYGVVTDDKGRLQRHSNSTSHSLLDEPGVCNYVPGRSSNENTDTHSLHLEPGVSGPGSDADSFTTQHSEGSRLQADPISSPSSIVCIMRSPASPDSWLLAEECS